MASMAPVEKAPRRLETAVHTGTHTGTHTERRALNLQSNSNPADLHRRFPPSKFK